MKLSKLDPMTMLMLVVAFGVVVTMLTQNSVASEEGASVKANMFEKTTPPNAKMKVSHMDKVMLDKKTRHFVQ